MRERGPDETYNQNTRINIQEEQSNEVPFYNTLGRMAAGTEWKKNSPRRHIIWIIDYIGLWDLIFSQARTTQLLNAPCHFRHWRAFIGILCCTIYCKLQELNHLFLNILVPEELKIENFRSPLLSNYGLHPSGEVNPFLVQKGMSGSLTS